MGEKEQSTRKQRRRYEVGRSNAVRVEESAMVDVTFI
jgi:hypothetical protein